LDIYRDLGNRDGEAEALNEAGTLHRVSDELAQAEGCHQQAPELACATASSWDEAHALAGLADASWPPARGWAGVGHVASPFLISGLTPR
jgi:hypothetical protein